MWYSPSPSYYEPPEEFCWDRTFEQRMDEFLTVYTYDNGAVFEEYEDEKSLKTTYNSFDELKEDGVVKLEVYEMWQEVGVCYGKHEDDYYEEVIDEGAGNLIYSIEF